MVLDVVVHHHVATNDLWFFYDFAVSNAFELLQRALANFLLVTLTSWPGAITADLITETNDDDAPGDDDGFVVLIG